MAQSLKFTWVLAAWLAWSAAAEPVRIEQLQESLTGPEESYVLNGLNWISDLYQQEGFHPRHDLRARVFATYAEFSQYQLAHRNFGDGSRPSPTAYFAINADELVTWRTRTLKSLFVHEGQHALLRSDFRHPPKWLNEGLSECFEGFDFSQAEPVYLAQAPRLRKVKRNLSDDFGRQVLAVLDMSEREFNQTANDRGLDSYTRAWALVYYFWTKTGARGLGELLRGLRDGHSAKEILSRLLPGNLEEQLVAFYRDMEAPPPPMPRTFTVPGSDGPPPMPPTSRPPMPGESP